jgi:hypothetical protein
MYSILYSVVNTRNVQQNLNMPLSSSVEHIIHLMLVMPKQVCTTIMSDLIFIKMPTRMTGHLGTCARMYVDACMHNCFHLRMQYSMLTCTPFLFSNKNVPVLILDILH